MAFSPSCVNESINTPVHFSIFLIFFLALVTLLFVFIFLYFHFFSLLPPLLDSGPCNLQRSDFGHSLPVRGVQEADEHEDIARRPQKLQSSMYFLIIKT